MMRQNIYAVRDYEHCPDGEGEPIKRYLNRIFTRVASQIASVRAPIDWLVIKSDDLNSVVHGSRNFFYARLERALQIAVTSKREVSVFRNHGIICGGAISEKDVRRWIREKLGHDFEANYLNELNLGLSFIGYHLNMR